METSNQIQLNANHDLNDNKLKRLNAANLYFVLCFLPKRYESTKQTIKMPNQFFAVISFYCDESEVNYDKYLEFENKYHPQVIVVIEHNPTGLYGLPLMIRQKALSFSSLDLWNPEFAISCCFSGIFRTLNQPLFSIIITSFQSKDRINRVFESLKKQIYKNFEVVVYSDNEPNSDEEKYLEHKIKNFQKEIPFLRYYKPLERDGRIGYVKKRAFGLASGSLLCEMDHDDELTPECLLWIYLAAEKYKNNNLGLLFTESLQIHEGSKDPHSYGQLYAFGFNGDYKSLIRGKYHHTLLTPSINYTTVKHLIGLMNHLRVWTSHVYHLIGGHNENLSVSDDYDLIIRTLIASNVCQIPELGYLQYINKGHSNFTFQRNELIQYNCAQAYNWHRDAINKRIEQVTGCAYDEKLDNGPVVQDWLKKTFRFKEKTFELLYKPNDQDSQNPLISIVISTYKRPEDLGNALKSIFNQTYKNFEVYIIGDGCDQLDQFMNETIFTILPRKFIKEKIRWFNFEKNTASFGSDCKNYACKQLVKSSLCCFLDDDNEFTPEHLMTSIEMFRKDPDLVVTYCDFLIDGIPEQRINGSFRRGRVDSSSLIFKSIVLKRYPLMLSREESGVYWHDWVFFEPWGAEKHQPTNQATMIYKTKYNHQTYESIMSI